MLPNQDTDTVDADGRRKRRRNNHNNHNNNNNNNHHHDHKGRKRRRRRRHKGHNGDDKEPKKPDAKAPFNDKKIGMTPTDTLFDPTSGYGRTKKSLWPTTEAGRNFATNNPDLYLQYIYGRQGGMANANPIYNGATQFGNWLGTTRAQQYQDAWRVANQAAGGHLGFAEYMNSVGYGGDSRHLENALTTKLRGPVNTGNPFTSSSGGGAVNTTAVGGNPYAPGVATATGGVTAADGRRHKKKKHHGKGKGKNNSPDGIAETDLDPLTAGGGLMRDRLAFNSLVPSQRGVDTAFSFKPGRWAVF